MRGFVYIHALSCLSMALKCAQSFIHKSLDGIWLLLAPEYNLSQSGFRAHAASRQLQANNPKSTYYLFLSILLLLGSSSLYAADYSFELNTGTSYSSNVFRTELSNRDDVYFTVAPRFTMKMPLNKTYASFGLRGVLEQHVVESSADLQEAVLSGLGRYNPSDHVSFGIRDEVVVSGRLRSVEELSDSTRLREYTDNRFAAVLKYDFKGGNLVTSLEYANTVRKYRHSQSDDWLTNSGQIQLEYFLGNKTSTSLGLQLIKKSYQADIDYTSFPVSASLKRKLSSKFETTLSLGMEGRGYNEAFEELGWNEPTVSLNITGELAPNTKSRLLLHRRAHDSDFMTGYAFVSTAANMSLILALTDAARLTIQGIYSINDYVQKERKDGYFSGHIGIRHKIPEWGAVFFSYGYERRKSNIQRDTYQQHIFEIYHVVLF